MRNEVSIEDENTAVDTSRLDVPLEVLDYENPDLKKPSSKVKFINDKTLKLIQDMKVTMLES
ncbi:MAG: hypothetical protein ABIG42_03465, partial [bacterium]